MALCCTDRLNPPEKQTVAGVSKWTADVIPRPAACLHDPNLLPFLSLRREETQRR